ncbi:hypothetical protein CHS0354_022066 [Potamilus streckersoni]|uniref:Uncharacterized protein n=1 Tax=Potamilus streckersoni TaxID=2493646 RepID=A0AAE0W1K0_9BIVA|nr:hypothetical protein CHS0354_022066 [Potamilus streckersoni]
MLFNSSQADLLTFSGHDFAEPAAEPCGFQRNALNSPHSIRTGCAYVIFKNIAAKDYFLQGVHEDSSCNSRPKYVSHMNLNVGTVLVCSMSNARPNYFASKNRHAMALYLFYSMKSPPPKKTTTKKTNNPLPQKT